MRIRAEGRNTGPEWEEIGTRMKVVRLSWLVQLAVPALIIPSLSRSTRGITFPPGRVGVVVGVALAGTGFAVGALLLQAAGVVGGLVSAWLFGTAGAAFLAGSLRPTAYVKPICVGCRLLPVIKEHEAIHLSGVGREEEVWASMKARHSVQSLGLEGDPSICSFCPIPKRLSEQ